jgi:hypothetical protein
MVSSINNTNRHKINISNQQSQAQYRQQYPNIRQHVHVIATKLMLLPLTITTV